MDMKMTREERDEKIRQLEALHVAVPGREPRSFLTPVLADYLRELRTDRARDAIVDARAAELQHATAALATYVAATKPARVLPHEMSEPDDVMLVRLPTETLQPVLWDAEGEELRLPLLGFVPRADAERVLEALDKQNAAQLGQLRGWMGFTPEPGSDRDTMDRQRAYVAVAVDGEQRWSVQHFLTLQGVALDDLKFLFTSSVTALSGVRCTKTLGRWFAEEQRAGGVEVAARGEWSEPRSDIARAIARQLATVNSTPRAAYAWWLARFPAEPEPVVEGPPPVVFGARPKLSAAQRHQVEKIIAADDAARSATSAGEEVTDGSAA